MIELQHVKDICNISEVFNRIKEIELRAKNEGVDYNAHLLFNTLNEQEPSCKEYVMTNEYDSCVLDKYTRIFAKMEETLEAKRIK